MPLPWVRLDTSMPDNPKILHLVDGHKEGRAAAFVWVCSLTYAGKHGTDGFITRSALARINGRPIYARLLCEAGLWKDEGVGWSINGWDETLTTRVTFDALSIDAVEKGIGDNEFHDAPVRVEMDIRGWLGALWEGRVQVDDNGRRSRSAQGTYEEYQPKETFIPTFKRVEAVLTAQECFDRMLVDQVNLGFFRVRAAKFGPDKTHVPLEPLVDAFQKAGFAAMVTCPTGHYGDRPEILVAPPPPPPGESIHTHGLQEDHHMDSVPYARP